jgi:hypothetical protein
MTTTSSTPVFTTDKFQANISVIERMNEVFADEIRQGWINASGTTRYAFWDYQNELEREIERVLRPTRFNY